MPVGDEDATRRFFVEAMRANTEALRANTKTMEGLAHRVDKIGDDVQDVRERMIRIEANPLSAKVEANCVRLDRHSKRIDALERDKDRRDGAMSGFDWAMKNWPGIIGFVAMIVVVLASTGRLG